jgi:hypothetical protein
MPAIYIDSGPYLLSSVRTCLGPHLTHVFGQVDAVKQTVCHNRA